MIKRTGFIFAILFAVNFIFAQSEIKTNIYDLNDEDKIETNLDSIINKYEGKVIYLDFWASWCSPCKREMPYSHKLQDKFKEKDVVFVYISTDRNAAAWKGTMDKLKLTGELYRVNKNVYYQMNDRFNVQYIPRYVLIDKKGKVVDDNAKRPSDPNVVADIEKLL